MYVSVEFYFSFESELCNYERFQIDQIPCPHTIAILKVKHVKEFGPHCSDYYKPGTLVKTYELPIISMSNKKDWNVPKSIEEEEVCHRYIKDNQEDLIKGEKRNQAKRYHQAQIIVDDADMRVTIDVSVTFFRRRKT